MKWVKLKFLFFLFCVLLWPTRSQAVSLSVRLAGRILLDVDNKGEAWYVNPVDSKRYYLGRPSDAFAVMRSLGLGISEANFQKIAQAGMPVAGDEALSRSLSGRIILRVENKGEAWYVNPADLKKYYLGRPEDALAVMRQVGLGISRRELAMIHKPGLSESIDKYSSYESKKVSIASGATFEVDVVEIDLNNPKLKIITETADDSDCEKNCSAKNLAELVFAHDGFAGFNGTYFDTSLSKLNYYFFPVYNTRLGKMINEDQLKYWTTGPIMAFDAENNFFYFKDSREFKSVEEFEKKYGCHLQAALGNKPRLIENKQNLLIDWDIDEKQRTAKAWRNAIGYKAEFNGKGKLYLVVAKKATVVDLADICKALGFDYALNTDGGYSAAMIYNGEYMVGPGRNIPNALIFSLKD